MRLWLLGVIFLFSLNLGVTEALGINTSLLRVAIEASMVLLLADALRRASLDDLLHAFKGTALPMLATSIGVGAALLNHSNLLEVLLFLREMLVPLMYFAMFLLAPPDSREWKVLTTMILIVFAIQLPVAALKYWTSGINEKIWIGTFHQHAGQLGLLMPMLGVSFLWAYAIKRQRLLIPVTLATCFAMISVVNEKRSIVLVMPALVLLIIGVDIVFTRMAQVKEKELWYLKPRAVAHILLAFLASSSVTTVFALRSIPSFDVNTIDYNHIPSPSVPAYIQEYLTRDYDSPMNYSSANPSVDENRNIQLGRFRLWQLGVEECLALSRERCLFGAGGGWLLKHPMLTDKPVDFMFQQLHLRGPASTGFRHLFEIGAIGLLLMVVWIAQIGWDLIQRASDPRVGLLALGATGAWGLLAFDYLLYSQVGWSAGVFLPVCFLVVAAALRNDRYAK